MTPIADQTHPFDAALALTRQDACRYLGSTHPAWANMVGPFGGITAATVTQAILDHSECLGEPVSLTVNFATAIANGPFELNLRIARTNRSTQHWVFEILQTQKDGSVESVFTGTAMTAARRETWSANDLPMPKAPPPETLEAANIPQGVEWLTRFDMRGVAGGLPQTWDGAESTLPSEKASLTQLWVRDRAGRAMDFAALTAFADIFYPRVWVRRTKWVPAGTVSMTVYFHADSAQLSEVGSGFLLAQARGQVFRNGFFDQSGCLWSEAGVLLATTHQLVYYKE
jgi:acyl-CoA thioesterase